MKQANVRHQVSVRSQVMYDFDRIRAFVIRTVHRIRDYL